MLKEMISDETLLLPESTEENWVEGAGVVAAAEAILEEAAASFDVITDEIDATVTPEHRETLGTETMGKQRAGDEFIFNVPYKLG